MNSIFSKLVTCALILTSNISFARAEESAVAPSGERVRTWRVEGGMDLFLFFAPLGGIITRDRAFESAYVGLSYVPSNSNYFIKTDLAVIVSGDQSAVKTTTSDGYDKYSSYATMGVLSAKGGPRAAIDLGPRAQIEFGGGPGIFYAEGTRDQAKGNLVGINGHTFANWVWKKKLIVGLTLDAYKPVGGSIPNKEVMITVPRFNVGFSW